LRRGVRLCGRYVLTAALPCVRMESPGGGADQCAKQGGKSDRNIGSFTIKWLRKFVVFGEIEKKAPEQDLAVSSKKVISNVPLPWYQMQN
jgi:hypothetical protein